MDTLIASPDVPVNGLFYEYNTSQIDLERIVLYSHAPHADCVSVGLLPNRVQSASVAEHCQLS